MTHNPVLMVLHCPFNVHFYLIHWQRASVTQNAFLTLGWSSSDLSCRQPHKPGQVPGVHRADSGSRKGPVQVLGHPLPAGETRGYSDGRAGLEQSRVTGEKTSGVIPLALMHSHGLSSHMHY